MPSRKQQHGGARGHDQSHGRPHDHAGDRAHDHAHDHSHDHEHDQAHEELQECIEECLNCYAGCTITAQHCLVSGGRLAEVNLVSVLLDCAEVCTLAANFMLRGSPYHTITCGACAEVCRACAEGCRTVEGDEQLAHCAEMCDACAESCERMAAGHRSGAGGRS